MQWNKKYIGICLAALILLAGILAIKGIRAGVQDGMETAVREEQFSPEDSQSVSGSAQGDSATVEKPDEDKFPKAKPTAASKAPATDKGRQVKPTESAGGKKAEKTRADKKKAAAQTDKKKQTKDSAAKSTQSPLPDRQPLPTKKAAEEKKREVTLQIDCTRIMSHTDLWKDGLEDILPDSGMFFSGVCLFRQGDSAYDVLKETCQKKDIALDSQYTPIYNTYYIRGIGNLYEFDCGEESGWKYAVNGKTPGVGCSGYTVKSGDVITFFYDYRYL